MFNTLTRAATLGAAMTAAILTNAAPAFAQAPSEGQREAIKSECRSDYIAHCSSIPPGGEASLQCLQKNMSSLAPSCQSAVKAVDAPAAPKTESAPAAATAKPATETTAPKAATTAAPKTAAKQPTSAQISAIRSACRSDYPKVCAGVPTGGAPALQCLERNKAKLSANCEKAVAAASGGTAAPAAGAAPAAAGSAPAAAAAPAAPVVIVLRPMRPREELFVLRSACGADVRSICGGVAPGGGRIIQCLATNAASLSPACQDVLSQFQALQFRWMLKTHTPTESVHEADGGDPCLLVGLLHQFKKQGEANRTKNAASFTKRVQQSQDATIRRLRVRAAKLDVPEIHPVVCVEVNERSVPQRLLKTIVLSA